MSEISDLRNQVAILTQRLNDITVQGRKIPELPEQSILDPASLIHVSNEDVISQYINIQQILDAAISYRQNQLIYANVNLTDTNEITVDANAQWIINNIDYSTDSNTVFNIPYAQTGYTRYDILYGNQNNEIIRLIGPETEGVSPIPNKPLNAVLISIISITDSTVNSENPAPTVPTIPENGIFEGDYAGDPSSYFLPLNAEAFLVTINDVPYINWVQNGNEVIVSGFTPTVGYTDKVIVYYLLWSSQNTPNDSYVKKIESEDFIANYPSTTIVEQIDLGDNRSSISLEGIVTDVKSIEVLDQFVRPGKPFFIKNRTGHDVKLWNLSGTGNVKISFPSGLDLIVKNKEVISFNLNANESGNLILEYVGGVPSSSSVLAAKTGATIVFTEDAVYNEDMPITTSITLSDTGQISGKVAIMYHKSTSLPTLNLPVSKSVNINNEEYVADGITTNVMYFLALPSGNYSLTTRQYNNRIGNHESEIQAIITAANTAGEAVPSNIALSKLDVFVAALKNIRNDANTANDNLFNYIDLIEVYVNSQREFSKYNIVNGIKSATEVNGVVLFSNAGFKASSTTNYLTVGGNMKSVVSKMTQNNASVYVYQNGATLTGYMCGVIDSVDNTKRISIGKNLNNTDAFFALNGNQVTVAATPIVNGGVLLDRINNTEFKVYQNGVLTNTVTSPSIDIPNNPMGVCARNFSPQNSQDCVVSLIMYGKSIRDFQNNFHQLVQNLM